MSVHNNLSNESLGMGNSLSNPIPSNTPNNVAPGYVRSIVRQLDADILIKELANFEKIMPSKENKQQWVKTTIVKILSKTSGMDNDSAKNVINRVVEVVKKMPKSIIEKLPFEDIFKAYINNNDINKAIDIIGMMPKNVNKKNFLKLIISQIIEMDKTTIMQVMNRIIDVTKRSELTAKCKDSELETIYFNFLKTIGDSTRLGRSKDECREILIEFLNILPLSNPSDYLARIILQDESECFETIIKNCIDFVEKNFRDSEKVLAMTVRQMQISKNDGNFDRALSVVKAIHEPKSKESLTIIKEIVDELCKARGGSERNDFTQLATKARLVKVIDIVIKMPDNTNLQEKQNFLSQIHHKLLEIREAEMSPILDLVKKELKNIIQLRKEQEEEVKALLEPIRKQFGEA